MTLLKASWEAGEPLSGEFSELVSRSAKYEVLESGRTLVP